MGRNEGRKEGEGRGSEDWKGRDDHSSMSLNEGTLITYYVIYVTVVARYTPVREKMFTLSIARWSLEAFPL